MWSIQLAKTFCDVKRKGKKDIGIHNVVAVNKCEIFKRESEEVSIS